MSPMKSDGEDTGPITVAQPSLHPTGLFVNKTPSQDDVGFASNEEKVTSVSCNAFKIVLLALSQYSP